MIQKSFLTYLLSLVIIFIIALNFFNLYNSRQVSTQTNIPGSLVYWGTNEQVSEQNSKKKSHEVLWLSNIKKLSAGHDHMLALSKDGTAYALGSNTFGQLGNNGGDYQDDPEKLAFIDKATDIAASGHHSLAVDKEGAVWSWGLNLSSQLGDGKNDIKVTPQKISGLPKVKSVAAGYRFSLALTDDGRVMAWGATCDPNKVMDSQSIIRQFASSLMQSGGYGDPGSLSSQAYQFSDDCNREKSTGINSKTPKVIEGLSGIKKLTAGFGHTMALKDDGTVWMLGCNKYGQIGNGSFDNAFTIEHRKELSNIVDIAAGYRHSLALDKDGNLWAWGFNGTGQLGLNSDEWRVVPTKIPSITNVVSIAAGYDYSLAITKDGTVWGWGTNASHQISSMDIKNSKVPIKLDMIHNANIIAAGGTQAIATIKE
jgi:alpha-tubulin suppressor-like RCC1 family protein